MRYKFVFLFFFLFAFSTLPLNADLFSDDEPENKGKNSPVVILSLDGGGIRGIYELTVLDYLEKELGGPIANYVDVIGGCSIGGVIASALNLPATFEGGDPKVVPTYDKSYGSDHPKFSAEDILKGFELRCHHVFKKNSFSFFRNAMYSRKGIDQLAKDYLGDTLMSETIKPELLATYDMSRARPYFLTSHKPSRVVQEEEAQFFDIHTPNFTLADAVRATTAAPTYFAPVKIYALDQEGKRTGNHYTMADGGIYANNPVLPTLEYAHLLYPETPLDQFVVISIGTGTSKKTYTYEEMNKWKQWNWLNPAIDAFMGSSMDFATMLADSKLNNNGKKRCFRLNGQLSRANHSLSDCSRENINNLKQDACVMLGEHKDDIEKIVSLLKKKQKKESLFSMEI